MDQPVDAAIPAPGLAPRRLARVFRAFSYRDYRLLWSGAFTSSCGTWMQEVAQNWLILSLTGSASLLALDNFLGEVPFILFTLVAGVVADRADRKKILMGSQLVQMTNAFLLAAVLAFFHVAIWEILALSFLTGLAQSFGGPAYQALVPTLVAREDVPNAVALQSIQFNLARVIGPVLAGFAFTGLGAAACFALNGLSFFAVIAALLALRITFVRRTDHPPVLESLRDGLRFVFSHRALTALVALAFAGSFFAFTLVTFLPVYAKTIFAIGPKGYGLLLSAFGIGAVVGALAVASLGNFRRKAIVAISLQIAFGLLMAGFALSRRLYLSVTLLFLAAVALVMVFAIFMSLVQLLVSDDLRGRVGSVYMLAFRGAIPLGSAVAGLLVLKFSVPHVLFANGILLACTATTVLWLRGRDLAPL
jgi:predicted MFS family arabinose efflux permease